jgi:hypothetical protein
MSDEPENLMPVYLRRLDAKMDRLQTDLTDVKHRVTVLETQLGQLLSIEQSHYASIQVRIYRVDERLERMARRVDLTP